MFTGGGGPDLYGTEPWTYYFANCLLNFNIVFLLSLLAWPLLEITVSNYRNDAIIAIHYF